MISKNFLTINFDIAPNDAWKDRVISADRTKSFNYFVTPNVDHIVQLTRNQSIRHAYQDAAARICDSRVLQKLALLKGIDLKPYPGSDLVQNVLNDQRANSLKIAILGPSLTDFEILKLAFPKLDLVHLIAPLMVPGDENWENVLSCAEKTTFDILLLCISFPKQELFAQALYKRGKAAGLGLCVGASLDFQTGKQKRAPLAMQKLTLEWLFRLLSNPKLFWRRYLVHGPRIFWLFFETEVWERKKADRN